MGLKPIRTRGSGPMELPENFQQVSVLDGIQQQRIKGSLVNFSSILGADFLAGVAFFRVQLQLPDLPDYELAVIIIAIFGLFYAK